MMKMDDEHGDTDVEAGSASQLLNRLLCEISACDIGRESFKIEISMRLDYQSALRADQHDGGILSLDFLVQPLFPSHHLR